MKTLKQIILAMVAFSIILIATSTNLCVPEIKAKAEWFPKNDGKTAGVVIYQITF